MIWVDLGMKKPGTVPGLVKDQYMLPPLSAICDYTCAQAANGSQQANESQDHAGTDSRFREGESTGIDYGERYG